MRPPHTPGGSQPDPFRGGQAPGPLGEAPLLERLARWDELPPEDLERLEADPSTARALARLRELEAELDAVAPPELPCPDPEELYSFAGGPGAQPVAPLRRAPLEAHVRDCRPCAELVSTLRATPPPPLLDAEPEAPLAGPGSERAELGSLLRWAPAAAAAAVLLAATQPLGGEAELGTWPEQPTMRGARTASLAFPRGRVLAGALGTWATRPVFEVGDVEADGLIVRVRRHAGGAFEEGELVAEVSGSGGQIELGQPLGPGSYTWEVEALQSGARTWLGSREFQVVEDAEVVRGLLPRQGVAAIEYLHEQGFLTDARAAARLQPASPGRDAYLRSQPAR